MTPPLAGYSKRCNNELNLWKHHVMNYEEALLTVALYAFILSALCLPFIIGYFTNKFHKLSKRLDEAIGIVIETEKYNGKESNGESS